MKKVEQASLENLLEAGLLEVEILHPGGLALVDEFAVLCGVQAGTKVLDVACGTGETACYLTERFGARVVGLDQSPHMIQRAEEKALSRDLQVELREGDANDLPFADASFDVVICECTLCLLKKEQVLREMVRVARPGGRVGMHDLCWQPSAPKHLRETLAEIESERPETLEGWQRLFVGAGLKEVRAADRSFLILPWMKDSKKRLGLIGQLKLAWRIFQRWGVSGLWRILRSERVFSSGQIGYGIVIGTKR